MFFQRNKLCRHAIAWWILLQTLPFFIGMDYWTQSARASQPDPEHYPYELDHSVELENHAQTLGFSASEIFEWVRQEVQFEPYEGSVKGALGTFRSKSGNQIDQVVLLATLLDEANKPWRLVQGDVRLTIQQAMAWLGQATPTQAIHLLESAGIDHKPVGSATQPSAVILKDHLWLEVQADYFPMRGAAADDVTSPTVRALADSEDEWIALDPAVTLKQSVDRPALEDVLGIQSDELLTLVRSMVTVTPVKDSNQTLLYEEAGLLPEKQISKASIDATLSLLKYIETHGALDQLLNLRGGHLQKTRQGLPGNLPYEIIGHVKRIQKENAGTFLQSKRRYLSIQLGDADGQGLYDAQIGLPRLSRHALGLGFEVVSSGINLNDYANQMQVQADGVRLEAVFYLDGEAWMRTRLYFNLGDKLTLKLTPQDGDSTILDVVSGGFYAIGSYPSLSRESAQAMGAAMEKTMQAIQVQSDHLRPLSQYLGFLNQATQYQMHSFTDTAAASFGYAVCRPVQQPLVTGIEPTLAVQSGKNVVTSPTLVMHWPERLPVLVERNASPLVKADAAAKAVSLVGDLALTASMRPMTGFDGFESATRLMQICGSAAPPSREVFKTSDAAVLDGLLPAALISREDVKTSLENALRNQHLMTVNQNLHTSRTLGSSADPAGWSWWQFSSTQSRGRVFSARGQVYSAGASFAYAPDMEQHRIGLYPLDLIHGGSADRYTSLLVNGQRWSDLVVDMTTRLSVGAASGALLMRDWLTAKTDGSLDAVALPAAAIVLHGMADYFSRPSVEAFTVDPVILNSAATQGLLLDVTMNMPVDEIKLEVLDAAGNLKIGPSSISPGPDRRTTYTLPVSTLGDGSYQAYVWGRYGDVASEKKSTTFIVDNISPTVALASVPTVKTKNFIVYGTVDDANLQKYTLSGRPAGGSWTELTSGTATSPIMRPLTTLATDKLGWHGNVELRLQAEDRAGNAATTESTVQFFNDMNPPHINISLPAMNGTIITSATTNGIIGGTVPISVSVDDLPDSSNRGLKRVQVWFENEDAPDRGSIVLLDTTLDKSTTFTLQRTLKLNTYRVDRNYAGDRFKICVEATDLDGNRAVGNISGLDIGNSLLYLDLAPDKFISSKDERTQGRGFTTIDGFFKGDPPTTWTLKVGNLVLFRGNQATKYVKSVWWGGASTNNEIANDYVAPGVYAVKVVDETDKDNPRVIHSIPVTILSTSGTDGGYQPKIVRMALRNQAGETTQTLFLNEGGDGSALVATSDYPFIDIYGRLDDGIEPYLDGNGEMPDLQLHPYADAVWTVEVKSSMAFPTLEDATAADRDAFKNLTDRKSWSLLACGNAFGNDNDGTVTARLDTSNLPVGYYDVRLWVTDGQNMGQMMATYIKVTRGPITDPGNIGAMTLSATDMTVPFTAFTAEVTRGYDSTDIYAPGPLGYGWRLHGIHLGIEPIHQTDEHDEAMITLPDGRRFFFANNPTDNASTGNQWVAKGGYTTRPYGMNLYRPGGSVYHETTVYSVPVYLAPGAPGRQIPPFYTASSGRRYLPGQVAYLQVEDKTWYIFEWHTGDLLEIIKPTGQVLEFKREGDVEEGESQTQGKANILIEDSVGRSIRIERDLDSGRINRIIDPLGNAVTYEYDKYDNLITVTDRSGRKRFYIYDTPEAKSQFTDRKDLTGQNIHYLVDVRVDDSAAANQDLKNQTYPGNRSVLKVSYDGGKMKGMEQGPFSVSFDYKTTDQGGTQTATGNLTGAKTTTTFNSDHQATQETDPYGNSTNYSYGSSGNMQGVMTKIEHPLGAPIEMAYPDYYAQLSNYSSYAAMFKSYVNQQISSDVDQPGYISSALTGPSYVTQGASHAEIGYDNTPASLSVFSPTTVTDLSGNVTDMHYDPLTGKASEMIMKNLDGSTKAQMQTVYYRSGDTDLIYGGIPLTADSPHIGRMKSMTASGGTQVQYGYRYILENNQLVAEEHAERDLNKNKLSKVTVDAIGRQIAGTDDLGRQSNTKYDGEGRTIESTNVDGATTYYDYDIYGRLLKERRSLPTISGEPVDNITTTYTYDDLGNVVNQETRDSAGNLIEQDHHSVEYSQDGQTETLFDDRGGKTISRHDFGGRLISTERYDAQDKLTDSKQFAYDENGRLIQTTSNKGTTEKTEFDDMGRVHRLIKNIGSQYSFTTEYGYDAAMRRVWTRNASSGDPVGILTSLKYNSKGKLEEIHYGDTLDTDGQPNYAGSQGFERFEYDTAGRLQLYQDAEGRKTRYTYNEAGKPTLVQIGYIDEAHQGLQFQFEYDAYGNQTRTVDPLGRDRYKVYDSQNRLWREFGPVCNDAGSIYENKRSVIERVYDEQGSITERREGMAAPAGVDPIDPSDPNTYSIQPGRWERYKFDRARDLITEKSFSDGVRMAYRYDDEGRLSRTDVWRTVSGGGEVSQYFRQYQYDSQGRIASETTPEGYIAYTYDDAGRVFKIQSSTGQEYEYWRDVLGNLTTVLKRRAGSVTPDEATRYTYYPTGELQRISYPNGTQADYTWERGLVSRIVHSKSGSEYLRLEYARDKSGLVTGETETRLGEAAVHKSYKYDYYRRLVRSVSQPAGGIVQITVYACDDAGNRTMVASGDGVTTTTTSYQYNSLGQLDSDGTSEYSYDAYGQLAAMRQGQSVVREIDWNARGRMAAVRLYQNGELAKTLSFGYSDSNELIKREATGEPPENYLIDDLNPSGRPQVLAELDGGRSLTRSYTYGSSGLLSQEDHLSDGANQNHYIHADRQGSTRLVTNDQGNEPVNARYDYKPYGEPTRGDDSLTRFAYNGQRREPELGLQYHHARWYQPNTANWLSPDPVNDFPNNFGNPYAYCGASPTSATDPTGTSMMLELAVVAGLVAELGSIDIFAGLKTLRGYGAKSEADFIVHILNKIGIMGLGFLPVIGFIMSIKDLPDTTAMVVSSIDAIGKNLGKGDLLKAALSFGMLLLAVITIAATVVTVLNALKGPVRWMSKAAFKAISEEGRLYENFTSEYTRLNMWGDKITVSRSRFPCFNEAASFKAGMGTQIQAHHVLPRKYAEMLGFKDAQIDEIIPCYVLTDTEHYALTTAIERRLPWRNNQTYTAVEIRAGLADVYEEQGLGFLMAEIYHFF